MTSPHHLLAVLMCASMLLTGCVPDAVPQDAPAPLSVDASGVVEPGLVRWGPSDTEAVGTVVYRRDQGGFFALADIAPSGARAQQDAPRIIAVLVHPDGTPVTEGLGYLVGTYCRIIGTTVEASGTAFTAPLLSFDTYHVLRRPGP